MQKIIAAIFLFLLLCPSLSHAQERFFDIQSIDTMKYSRDRARDPTIIALIPFLVQQVASLHPTHIALGTPYEDEFYPIMKKWVKEARKNHLKVWFRGNVAGWEGWFDYPKLQTIGEHHATILRFITIHPDLFEKGDIFTPAPEPEQGFVGDPRKSEEIKQNYLRFLIDSYNNCNNAMLVIGVETTCGYFSMNGDIAKEILDKKTVKQIGNLVTIDHYVKDPEKLRKDILFFYDKFDAQIVLGEFGAPIPDIHGEMNEKRQAEYIKKMMVQLLTTKHALKGVNYWTAFDGSTALFTSQFKPKKAIEEIRQVYNPLVINGVVKNIFDEPVNGITVSSSPFFSTKTNSLGSYQLLTIIDYMRLTAQGSSYTPRSMNLSQNNMGHVLNFSVDYKNKTIWYYLRLNYQKIVNTIKEYYRSKLS